MGTSAASRMVFALVAACAALSACDRKQVGGNGTPEPDARDAVTGLTALEAAEVLATVGTRKITLGEYASSLARMDRFERLRYQSEERQKQLLDEMIEVELLAQEARRRGLEQDPTVQLRIQQALRDELLMDLKRSLPEPAKLSEREVREYYDAHRNEFWEPRRHRVLAIVVGSAELAKQLAAKAEGASGADWAALAKEHSLDRPTATNNGAFELAGDLGFVSAPGEARGANPDVPEAVRRSVFTLQTLGQVAPEPAQAGARYYVVRLGGVSAERQRSLSDADANIRTELLRQKYLQAERQLGEELKQRFPVVLDVAALDQLAASSP